LILEPTVRRIDKTETDAVLDVLTLAFAADPCARYAWPSPAEYLRASPRPGPWRARPGTRRGVRHRRVRRRGLPRGVEPDADALGELIEDTL
jgi:hypothetical protein